MRSPRGVAAALILLLGVPLAFITAIAFGDGAENVIHMALAAIFLLQVASDLTHSAPLQHLAYQVLGQRVEKVLGYAFLCWCVAMLFRDSTGKTKAFGVVVVVAILFIEIYTVITVRGGGEAPEVLKLFYLPLFIWLLLEGKQHRGPAPRTSS